MPPMNLYVNVCNIYLFLAEVLDKTSLSYAIISYSNNLVRKFQIFIFISRAIAHKNETSLYPDDGNIKPPIRYELKLHLYSAMKGYKYLWFPGYL